MTLIDALEQCLGFRPTLLWADIETYCATPIKHGTHSYARGAEIMTFQYAVDDAEPTVWDLTTGAPMPADLREALDDPRVVKVAHNYGFETAVLRYRGYPVDDWHWHCTMAQALQHGLPGALDKLSKIFKLGEDEAKIADGKKLIQLFCVPRPKNMKVRRATSQTHPAEWQRFLEYARNDITAMRAIAKKLPTWNLQPAERRLFDLDGVINTRGVHIDTRLARAAVRAIAAEQKRLAERTVEVTAEELKSTTQVAAFRAYLAEHYDIDLPDMRAATVEKALSGADLPDEVRELLLIRAQTSLTSSAKYKAVLDGVCPDDRMRGTLQFSGAARTSRWSGRTLQPQNLPRPTMKQEDIDTAIDAFKHEIEDIVLGNVMEAASNSIRGMIVAAPGMKLVQADLSNIEGRVLAWLAGEEWKLQAFREFDAGEGPDLYKLAYSKSFNKPIEEVTKDDRFIGKVQELACFGADTLVLTRRGWAPIVAVRPGDEVWDGVEWVACGGVVARGRKETIDLDGVRVTPDHQIFVADGVWAPAANVAGDVALLFRARLAACETPTAARAPVASVRDTPNVFDVFNAGPRGRFTVLAHGGPLIVHNCGYQGAVGAFSSMAALYGAVLPEDEVIKIVKAWRRANAKITAFWYDVERAARSAIINKGQEFVVGKLVFDRVGAWLRVRLPSGRYLCYPSPMVDGETGKISFMGVDPYTKQFKRLKTYGGKLCIAAGTRVVTDRGAVPIEAVTAAHKVWDGVEWVGTAGAVHNGRRGVICAHGVRMTPDHLVLTTKGWIDASQSERHHRAACRLPDGFDVRRVGRSPLAVDDVVRLRAREDHVGDRLEEVVVCGSESVLRLHETRNDRDETVDARDVSAPSVRGVAVDAGPLSTSDAPGLAQLRRARDNSLRALAGVVRRVLGRHGANVPQRVDAGSRRQLGGVLAGELQVDDVQGAGSKPSRSIAGGHRGTLKANRHCKIDAGVSAAPWPAPDEVYDLVDCGPRHRFVVLDDNDEPLIVHNCENACQAVARDVLAHAMPRVEDAGYRIVLSVHDELITEAPDTPAFTSDALCSILTTGESWTADLPLNAEGFEAYRYRK